MNWQEYQRLASRTECPPDEPRRRIAGELLGVVRELNNQRSYVTDRQLITRLLHSILGILDEAGELAKALKKTIFYGKDLDVVNVAEELGDLLWYIALMANALDLSLEEIAEKNIAKLKVRFPDKYSDVCAAEENRNRSSERKAVATILTEPYGNSDQEYLQKLASSVGGMVVPHTNIEINDRFFRLQDDPNEPFIHIRWDSPETAVVYDLRGNEYRIRREDLVIRLNRS